MDNPTLPPWVAEEVVPDPKCTHEVALGGEYGNDSGYWLSEQDFRLACSCVNHLCRANSSLFDRFAAACKELGGADA